MNVLPIQPETVEVIVCFATWYMLYPRHEARKDANRAWDALSPDDQYEAICAIAKWRKVFLDRAQGRGVIWIPLPATWLRAERWTDELPEEYRNRAASHQSVPATVLPERGVIPADVLTTIKRLTGVKK